MQKKIALLGSTGSIGTQTLSIVDEKSDEFCISLLSIHSSWQLLLEQTRKYLPKAVFIADSIAREKFIENSVELNVEVLGSDIQHLLDFIASENVDIVMNALVGFAGFRPSMQALKSEKRLCLANKESLVVGGELIQDVLRNSSAEMLPVDSEHSALFQCLLGEDISEVETLILTASGGPFRTFTSEQIQKVTKAQALKHPNWDMGPKITIDSSTLMNKGLEFIEAYWLFGVPTSQITAVVHPQSIVHSMISFKDGSIKAHLGVPDMRVPIAYSLSYPQRMHVPVERLNWNNLLSLDFEPVDEVKFPCFALAKEAIAQGGVVPAVLNAANEIAVERFLNEDIAYISIPKIIEQCISAIHTDSEINEMLLVEIDTETRAFAKMVRV